MISRDGFLGDDKRPLRAILGEDDQRVAALGLTHKTIADRMRYLTEAGKARLGAAAVIDGVYEVRADDTRGGIPCAWPHDGLFDKTMVRLRRLDTGEELRWSELMIHLIGEHGFYQGKGSPYRLAPAELARVLGLLPDDARD